MKNLGHQVVAASPIRESGEIYAFYTAHRVGSICGFPCEQCGEYGDNITDAHGETLPPTPFFIVREATREEWEEAVRRDGGKDIYDGGCSFFYEVSTD